MQRPMGQLIQRGSGQAIVDVTVTLLRMEMLAPAQTLEVEELLIDFHQLLRSPLVQLTDTESNRPRVDTYAVWLYMSLRWLGHSGLLSLNQVSGLMEIPSYP